jgi:very-short-patch-repair endonuclease
MASRAGGQHGVVSGAQLGELGFTRDQIKTMAAKGSLQRLHRGVYAVGHRAIGRHGRWMAAVLAGGDGAALSHRSAAALWGFLDERVDRPVDVSVPGRRARKPRRGITFHRPQRVDSVVWHSVRVSRPIPTLFDIAATEPRREVERAIAAACATRGVDLAALTRYLAEHEPRARNRAAMRRVLRCADGSRPFRSPLERRLFALCDDHGFPRPLVNTHVGGYEADFYWPTHGLIVETDGRTHEFAWQQERDVARDEHHRSMGLTVMRISYAQMTYEPGATAARLAGKLRAHGSGSVRAPLATNETRW